jgi:D-alanyl-D-alanine endopeptidase (penicillin-binding protein 7)
MQARVNDRNVVMVFLDSVGKLSRFADATRVRTWLEHQPSVQGPQRPFPNSPNLTQGPSAPHAAHAILASQQARGT